METSSYSQNESVRKTSKARNIIIGVLIFSFLLTGVAAFSYYSNDVSLTEELRNNNQLNNFKSFFYAQDEPLDSEPSTLITIQNKTGEGKWNIIKRTGNEENLTLWTANAKDKKTEIGFIVRPGRTYNTVDKFLYNENDEKILDDKNKDIKLKYESSKCDGLDCYYISLTNAQAVNIDDYVKLGDQSIELKYEETKYLNFPISPTNNLTINLFWDVNGDGTYWANVNDVFVNGSKYGANGNEGIQRYFYQHKSTKQPRRVGESIVWKECVNDYYGLGSVCNVTELSLNDLLEKDYDVNFSIESYFENDSYISNAYFNSEEFIDPVISEGEFDGCGEIVTEGVYTLNSTIGPNIATTCITINSSNVVLNCQNFQIDGVNTGTGIFVDGATGAGQLTNVTIINANINDFFTGIELELTDFSYVINSSLTSVSQQALLMDTADNNNITGLMIYDANIDGVRLNTGSVNNIFSDGIILDSIGTTLRGFRFIGLNTGTIIKHYNITGIPSTNGGGIVTIGTSDNSFIYNTFLNNTINVRQLAGADNFYNTSLTATTSIIGGANSGGNYYAHPNGTGYSETCTVSITDNICDDPFNIETNAADPGGTGVNIDELPLSFETAGAADNEFPIFFNFVDNNFTTQGQLVRINVTINSTNGTVLLDFGGTNYTATNLTSNVYNVTLNITTPNDYTYIWQSWGNGTDENYNLTQQRHFFVNTSVIPEDNEYPIFSNPTETPNEPVEYQPNGIYEFNITLDSTNSTSGIEWNGVNYSIYNLSNVFNWTIDNLGLSNNTYYYWSFGNGTDENYNISQMFSYNVTINSSLLLGISGTTSITYGTTTDVAGSLCPTQLSCNLDKSNIVYSAGTETFNYSTIGNTNYSATSSTINIIINQAIPQGTLTGTTPILQDTTGDVEGTESNTGDNDVTYNLYRDNVLVSNPDTNVLKAGTYNYVYNTTGGANWTANASLDTFTLVITPKNTSYLGIKVEINDAVISSPTYATIKEFQFNTSEPSTNLGMLNSLNIEKLTVPLSSDVFLNITLDGVELFEGIIRSVESTNEPGVSGTDPLFANIANGEHTLTIQARRTGNGNVNLYNWDFSIGQFVTPKGIPGRGNLTSISQSFQSTTSITVYSKNISKVVSTGTYISSSFRINATGQTDVACRWEDGSNSPYFVVTIPDATSTKSVSTNYITEPHAQTEEIKLTCFDTNNEVVTIEGGFIEADMGDNNGSTINHVGTTNSLTNYTSTITLTAGNTEIVNTSFTIQNGTNLLASASISAVSLTGGQTPTYILHISNSSNNDVCNITKERYTATDIGNAFFYPVCENLIIGEEYHVSLHVIIETGAQLKIYDEAISLFENTAFDTITINTPPIVALTQPEEGDTLSGIVNINWTVSDPQGDTVLINVTAFNGTTTYEILLNQPTGTINGTWNTSLVADGIWNLTVNAYENDTTDFFNGNHTHSVTIANDDNVYPIFFNFKENPANGTVYMNGASYYFNTTVNNTNGSVGLTFNGINYSSTNFTSEFESTLSDLGAGNYNYFFWAYGNGGVGNYNQSSTFSYTVTTATPTGTLAGTSPITFGTVGDVVGTETNLQDADVTYNLYRDGTLVSNPDTTNLGAGNYNYVFNTTGGQNYSASSSLDTLTLTVNQATSEIATYINGTRANRVFGNGTNLNISAQLITGVGDINLYVNDTLWNTGNTWISNNSVFTQGIYTIKSNYTGNQNYTSDSETWTLTIQIGGASNCESIFTVLQSASSNKKPYGRLCFWLDFR